MDPPAAKTYLCALLNRSLHIYTTDHRLFVGDFKCTDNVTSPLLSISLTSSTAKVPFLPSHPFSNSSAPKLPTPL
jgi:hypothetical protein